MNLTTQKYLHIEYNYTRSNLEFKSPFVYKSNSIKHFASGIIFLCNYVNHLFTLQDESLGDLMVSMSYLASAERLTISVLKARYLQPPEDGKTTSSE